MYKEYLNEADVVIFDLDGTLYEGTEHFKLHVENLKSKLSPEKQAEFQEIYNAIMNGDHPVQIGKIYDGERDIVWSWDPFTEALTEARDWNNEVVNVPNAPTHLAVSEFDFKNWVPIGDGWWPPYAIARHFGIPIDVIQQSYNRTKEQMAQLDGYLSQTPGLKEYLQELKQGKHLIVCTNSDEEDAKRLLKFLEIEDYFEELLPSAMKPVGTKKHFNYLLQKYNTNPENAVSVGDNFMNEVAPALQLGMKAVWLSDAAEKPVDDDRFVLTTTLAQS
ncbi:putative hydrolase of the HAD superfamily [Aquisalibacillus elongatus]|uniref:Putative hydrolase of the HAD superfamily n=2 Tax=Aquisalibacillus elongatus TaxID=485577 RepID=A0A3N5B065_9BACI|nr:putative hydrolase of the HAD superfamily [Aquisalibacillus elongatus]